MLATKTKAASSEADRVAEIKRLHEAVTSALRTSLTNAIRIGELLTKQKGQMDHGEWGPWVEDNLPFTQQTANNYMRVYANRKELKLKNVFNLAEAYALLNKPKTKPTPNPEKKKKKKRDDADDDPDLVEFPLAYPRKYQVEFSELIDTLSGLFHAKDEFETIYKALWLVNKHRELIDDDSISSAFGKAENGDAGDLAGEAAGEVAEPLPLQPVA